VFLCYSAVRNAADNLARANIASGLGFWNQTAGFDISQTMIEYSAQGSTYGRAFWVGLLNTLLVAVLGIFFATIVGFVVGIARLSKNWLIGNIASCYVELIRNVPLLLQLLFWYNAVLKALPDLRDSWTLPGSIFLNNRGFFAPYPIFEPRMSWVVVAFVAGVVGAIAYRMWAVKKQEQTGEQSPVALVALGLSKDWAYRIIKLIGNYGEVFEKNVGQGSQLKIARGVNGLWTKGGLQYAPPIR